MHKYNSNITKNTKQRLNSEFLNFLKSGNFKFDIHTHLFNKDYIPDKYFGIRIPFLVNVNFLKHLDSILELVSSDEEDKVYFYAYFIDFVSKNSMLDIAKYLISNTPRNTIFCSLMMDFSKGIRGKTKKNIFEQLDEYKKIRDKYKKIFLPFLAIDPNNADYLKLFQKAFSLDYNFFGIKVYPAMGFLPSHPNLMKIFEICSKYDIPITAHTGFGGVHTNRTSLNIKYFDVDQHGKLFLKREKKNFFFKKQYEKFFNKPQNWEPVLKAFPDLRLNLSHFGGVQEWEDKNSNKWTFRIIDLMERYPNVYSDLSFIIYEDKIHKDFINLFNNNKTVAERTLFGTDFYMIVSEGKYKEIRSRFVTKIGSKTMHKISVENPLNFLNLRQFIPKKIEEKWQRQIL